MANVETIKEAISQVVVEAVKATIMVATDENKRQAIKHPRRTRTPTKHYIIILLDIDEMSEWHSSIVLVLKPNGIV